MPRSVRRRSSGASRDDQRDRSRGEAIGAIWREILSACRALESP